MMETTSEVNAVVPRVAENELHAALGCQLGSLNGAPPILAGALVEDPNSLAAPGFVDGMRRCGRRAGARHDSLRTCVTTGL